MTWNHSSTITSKSSFTILTTSKWQVPEYSCIGWELTPLSHRKLEKWERHKLAVVLRIAVHYDVHVHVHITDNEKLEMVLRPYTTDEFFTSEQVRCIIGKFKDPHARVCVQCMHASTRTSLKNFCISLFDPFSALSLLGAVQLCHYFLFPPWNHFNWHVQAIRWKPLSCVIDGWSI